MAAAEERAANKIAADIRMFSGCEDSQTSADVCDVTNFKLPDPAGRGGGACTSGLLQILYSDHIDRSADLSFEEVLYQLREKLDVMGLSQIPQLSSSRPMDMKQTFHIVPEGNTTGTRRAVMIGINYTGQDGELSGCQNDVKNMKEYLQDVHGFKDENIVLMLDDKKHIKPKRSHITKALKQLVKDSQPNDIAFVHFSGHGGKVRDFDGDEDDGFDETLIPVDFKKCGQIRDDYLYKTLVCPMKEGVTMTCVFDCCHSGTVLDLPFTFKGDGTQEAMSEQTDFDFEKLEEAVTAEASDDEDEEDGTDNESESESSKAKEEEAEPLEDPAEDLGETEEATPALTTEPPAEPAQSLGPPELEPAPSGNMQEVYVRHGRNSIVINADVEDKISLIKQELEQKTGVPMDKQELIYNGLGIKFANNKSLSYYGCRSGGFFVLREKKRANDGRI